MIALNNKLKFTRNECDGIYYADLNAKLNNAVKFDIYDNYYQIATLVTNNSKTLSLTRANNRLSLKSIYSWKSKWEYTIYKNDTIVFATVYIRRRFFITALFTPDVYNITFIDTNYTFKLTQQKNKYWMFLNNNFNYNFCFNDICLCSIINLKKLPNFYSPNTVSLEGIIAYENSITLEQILCFLQFINLKISLEHD